MDLLCVQKISSSRHEEFLVPESNALIAMLGIKGSQRNGNEMKSILGL